MKQRPWPLVILAICTFFMPLLNVYFNARLNEIAPLTYIKFYIENNNIFSTFSLLGLLPIAAICIYLMKKWSYYLFLSIFVYLFITSFYNWNKYYTDIIPVWLFVAFAFSYIFLVSYYNLPAVREIYFNKRLRWWETKPRYFLNIPIHVSYKGKETSCLLADISEGGCFINCDLKLLLQDNITITIHYLDSNITIHGKIVHARDSNGFGIEFHSTTVEKKDLKLLIKKLDKQNIPNRNFKPALWPSFKEWILGLPKGKGLVPEKIESKNKISEKN